jgi:hypothetical protein
MTACRPQCLHVRGMRPHTTSTIVSINSWRPSQRVVPALCLPTNVIKCRPDLWLVVESRKKKIAVEERGNPSILPFPNFLQERRH